MPKAGFVHILASKMYGTLYTGVTNDLTRRIWEHKNGISKQAFTTKYNVTRLVYMEEYDNIEDAIAREKQLKNWKRLWKIRLIESVNPEWLDLYDAFEY